MVLKSSFTFLVVATLAVFSANAPQAEAHSWAECVDWRFKGKKNDWSDKGGRCMGYARRFPLGHAFGTLDDASPNRHYMQYKSHPDTSPPCSNGRDGSERGSDETRANPPSKAYGGKFGRMTVTTVGSTLCVRWPAKTHASEYKVPNVQIYLSKNKNGKDISQKEFFKYKVADLPFGNCNKGGNNDKRPCGGCFKVPTRASGIYLLQWRWMLNKNEWYTSCADIQIGGKKSFQLSSLSLSLSAVSARGFHGIEKRAGPVCPTVYAPLAPGTYPALDCAPFVQDPQVQAWLKLVDFTKTPVYPPSLKGACPDDVTSIPKDRCWWTCQKCEAADDVTVCPKVGTWGLTYDNGPSVDSPRLYDVLQQHNTTATLFIVGSRAITYPETLKRAYKEGHHIAIHTWSHSYMTSLSNEHIVAELKWTEKAIFDIIGVKPIYWRPPFGDVDNRVRNIATQLGFKTAIWTQGFDTDDWKIPEFSTPEMVVDKFKS